MNVPGYVPAGFVRKPRSPQDDELLLRTPPPAAPRATTSRGVMTDGSEDAAPRAVADGRRSAPRADAFGRRRRRLSLPPPPPTPPPPSPPLSSPPSPWRARRRCPTLAPRTVADDRCEALLLGPLPTARAIDVGRNGAASPCLSGCSSPHRCGADGSGSPLSHRVALTFNELKARAHQQAVLVDAMRRERQVARSQLAILERERDYYKSRSGPPAGRALDAAAEHDAEAADPLRREAAYHAGQGRRARKPKAYLIESMANFTSLAKHLEIHDHS
ncbi:hypothetical protein SO694_00023053 [Aureococcus anophagefferens]|uniref:Uncharacterized protein n=1 Tax=Aureococcus anophagefferens TaxID=44056 RepID=A0ABR1FTG9_AURAN